MLIWNRRLYSEPSDNSAEPPAKRAGNIFRRWKIFLYFKLLNFFMCQGISFNSDRTGPRWKVYPFATPVYQTAWVRCWLRETSAILSRHSHFETKHSLRFTSCGTLWDNMVFSLLILARPTLIIWKTTKFP